jgi:hypothetical protein
MGKSTAKQPRAERLGQAPSPTARIVLAQRRQDDAVFDLPGVIDCVPACSPKPSDLFLRSAFYSTIVKNIRRHRLPHNQKGKSATGMLPDWMCVKRLVDHMAKVGGSA